MADAPAPSLKVKLILLGATTLFALGFAECGLRIVGRGAGSGWGGVPPIEDRLAAVTTTTKPRVLAIGDSFTEYKDDQGQNWFRFGIAGHDVDGVNLGQMGTGLAHYTKNLVDHGPTLKPSLVVVGVYLGNDIQDFEIELAKEARGMPVEPPVTTGRRTGGALQTLKESSRLLGMLARLVRTMKGGDTVFDLNLHHAAEIFGVDEKTRDARLAAAPADVVKKARGERINPWDLAFALIRPERYANVALLREGTDAVPAIERFEQALLKLEATCQAQSTTCVFVLIPAPPQVDERFGAYLKGLGYEIDARLVGPDTPLMTRLHAFGQTHALKLVDVLPALIGARDEELFLPDDTHLNDRGQEVAGAAVRQALEALNLLP